MHKSPNQADLLKGSPPLLRLLNLREVQSLIGGKSKSTIFRWISENSFPKGVKFRGSRMWTEDSIAEWQQQIINQ